MDKRKLKIALSLAVLIPCVLYAAGIIAQFIININAWKAAGSDYRTSPGLPSSQISEVVRALFHFPEGLIAIGVVVLGIAVLCVFGLRIGWGQNGVTDSDRNLTVSNSGSYGTASFMSPKEASACFEVTSAKRTSQDILGMLPDGQVLTLPKDTRLNANLAVCGSSGTGKSRAISRNLVLQAVKRGESVILTDPKSELYESMGEYLRENGYIVKVFNLVEMDHSDSWNCLGEVGSSELMAQTFADIVLQNTSGDSKDAFWYNAELNLLKALVLYVALEMPPEKRNIATVYDLLYTQTEKGLSDMMASISHSTRTNTRESCFLHHLHLRPTQSSGNRAKPFARVLSSASEASWQFCKPSRCGISPPTMRSTWSCPVNKSAHISASSPIRIALMISSAPCFLASCSFV